MYTYNEFIFGHDFSVDKELNNLLHDWDLEFRKKINNELYVVDFPYHGGQCYGDLLSTIFGIRITDNDGNKDYINVVRNSKEETYLKNYNIFLEAYLLDLYVGYDSNIKNIEDVENYIKRTTDEDAKDYYKLVERIKYFLVNNKPSFYQVQVSS